MAHTTSAFRKAPSESSAWSSSEIEALRLVVVRLERKLRKHSDPGVTPSQLSALFALQRHGPMRLTDLADREQVSKSTVTRLADNLVKKSLAVRSPNEADGRTRTIAISETGLRLLREAADRSNDYLRQRVDELDELSLDRLLPAVEILERIAEKQQ